jgi:endonuclease III
MPGACHVARVAERLGVAPHAAHAAARRQATTWQAMLPGQYRRGVC